MVSLFRSNRCIAKVRKHAFPRLAGWRKEYTCNGPNGCLSWQFWRKLLVCLSFFAIPCYAAQQEEASQITALPGRLTRQYLEEALHIAYTRTLRKEDAELIEKLLPSLRHLAPGLAGYGMPPPLLPESLYPRELPECQPDVFRQAPPDVWQKSEAMSSPVRRADESNRPIAKIWENAFLRPSGERKKPLRNASFPTELIGSTAAEQQDINPRDEEGKTALYRAAEKGDLAEVKALLRRAGKAMFRSDKQGRSPLHAAYQGQDTAYKGPHTDVITHLIEKGADPLMADNNGISVMFMACAANDLENVERFCLAIGKNKTKRGKLHIPGFAPFFVASERGFPKVVQCLLGERKRLKICHRLKIRHRDVYGRTPLSAACENGHEAVARVLVESGDPGLDLVSGDKLGRKPFLIACEHGHYGIVNFLVTKRHPAIDLMAADNAGRTPIFVACQQGHSSVVALLLSELATRYTLTLCDSQGRSCLSVAVAAGHSEIVSMLRQDSRCGSLFEDLQGHLASRPLCASSQSPAHRMDPYASDESKEDEDDDRFWAEQEEKSTKNNRYGRQLSPDLASPCQAKELIQRLSTAPATDDEGTREAILAACQEGANKAETEAMVRHLTGRLNDVDPNGSTLLLSAVKKELLGLVKVLVAHAEVDVNKTALDRCTPLFMAARLGNFLIAKALLAHPAIQPDQTGPEKVTALFAACEALPSEKHTKVVRLLIKHRRVGLNIPADDGSGTLPFFLICARGSFSLVKSICALPDLKVHKFDRHGRNGLYMAFKRLADEVFAGSPSWKKILRRPYGPDITESEAYKIVRWLKGDPRIHKMQCGPQERNLWWVAYQQRDRQMRMLLVKERWCSPMASNQEKSTPLHAICKEGWLDEVKAICTCYPSLLSILLNKKDAQDRTPLFVASENNRREIVSYLLRKKQVSQGCRDIQGRTALDIARKKGYKDIVKLLEKGQASIPWGWARPSYSQQGMAVGQQVRGGLSYLPASDQQRAQHRPDAGVGTFHPLFQRALPPEQHLNGASCLPPPLQPHSYYMPPAFPPQSWSLQGGAALADPSQAISFAPLGLGSQASPAWSTSLPVNVFFPAAQPAFAAYNRDVARVLPLARPAGGRRPLS